MSVGGSRRWLAPVAVGFAAASPFSTMLFSTTWIYEGRFITLMLAAALLVWAAALEPGDGGSAPSENRWRRMCGYGAGAFGVVAVVSAVLSLSPAEGLTFGAERSLMGAPTWLAFAAIAWAASRLRLTSALHAATKPATALAALVAIRAIAERLGGAQVVAWFGNGNYAGVAMLLALPFALVSWRSAKSTPERTAWLAAAGILVAGVLASASVTVLAAMLFGAVVAAFLVPELFGATAEGSVRAVRSAATALAVAGALLLAVALAAPQVLPAGVQEELRGTTLTTRAEMWKIALAVTAERPVLGAGPDGLMLASQPHLSLTQMRIEGAAGSGTGLLIRDPHALPLLLLASFGVLGTAAFTAMIVAWALAVRDASATGRRPVRVAYAIAFGAFLTTALLIPWVVTFSALPALLAGLALARKPDAGRQRSAERSPVGRKKAQARPARQAPPSRVAPAALAVAAAISLPALWMAGSAWAGQAALARFLTAPAESNAASMIAAQPTRGYLRYQRMLGLGDTVAFGQTPLASYRAAFDESPEALRANAVYLANIAQRVVDAAQRTGDAEALAWGGELAAEAVTRAPNHPDALLEAARAEILAGRLDAARERLDTFSSLGLAYPRHLLYEQLYAAASGDGTAAGRYEEQVRAVAPELRSLLAPAR